MKFISKSEWNIESLASNNAANKSSHAKEFFNKVVGTQIPRLRYFDKIINIPIAFIQWNIFDQTQKPNAGVQTFELKFRTRFVNAQDYWYLTRRNPLETIHQTPLNCLRLIVMSMEETQSDSIFNKSKRESLTTRSNIFSFPWPLFLIYEIFIHMIK